MLALGDEQWVLSVRYQGWEPWVPPESGRSWGTMPPCLPVRRLPLEFLRSALYCFCNLKVINTPRTVF